MNKITSILIGTGILIVIGIGAWFGIQRNIQPAIYDQFTTCLTNSGTKFFGAFWCPHCQRQKALFVKSANLLPYTECSTADGQGVTQVCKDANITGYPTWEFPDKTRMSGEVSLEVLAEKTSCTLPK